MCGFEDLAAATAAAPVMGTANAAVIAKETAPKPATRAGQSIRSLIKLSPFPYQR
jgi:hypothetical protein